MTSTVRTKCHPLEKNTFDTAGDSAAQLSERLTLLFARR
jgi:hypothetical protein